MHMLKLMWFFAIFQDVLLMPGIFKDGLIKEDIVCVCDF